MLRKRLFVWTTSILGVSVAATAVGLGYVFNKKSNQYQLYTSAPLTDSTTDLINCYFSAAVKGAKLIYLASYAHKSPITTALNITKQQNEAKFDYFSKTGYLLIDENYGFPFFDANGDNIKGDNQPFWSTNVASVSFRADLGSFISGIALGEFLNENQEYFLKNRKQLTWGIYGGDTFSSVTSFMGGFQQGVDWFNKNVVPKKPDYKKVSQVYIAKEQNANFVKGFGPNDGDGLIDQFLNENVCALIPVAGPQVQQAIRKIAQRGSKTIVIGVDSAIEENTTININLPNGSNIGNGKIVQFSSIKNIGIAVDKITEKINAGEINPGDANTVNEYFGGIGYSSLGTLKNNGVGVSSAGYEYFVKALMHAKSESTSGAQDWNELYQKYINDQIMQDAIKKCDDNRLYKIDGGETFYYSDIPLTGSYMLPITGTKQDIENWYDYMYGAQPGKMAQKQSNIDFIWNWKENNLNTLELREKFSLKNQLTKQEFEKDNNLTKIIFQSPTNVLFDSSFLESCYLGLYNYWEKEGIKLPLPDKLTK